MRTILSFIISVSFLSAQFSYARNVTPDTSTATPTTMTVTPTDANGQPIVTNTTMPPAGATIQTLAEQSAKSNNTGQLLGMAAIGVTGVGVAVTCPKSSKCPWFVAGLVASIAVTATMGKAKDRSNATAQAVSVDGSGATTVGGGPVPGGPSAPPLPEWQSDPNWQSGQRELNKLREAGWKIDTNTGNITTPGGKSYNASVVKSADTMKAAGASEADIKAYQDAMNQAQKAAAEKAGKAADSTEMLGDGSLGGGSKSSAGAADNFQVPAMAETGPKLGIDRNPAQVAGMKKIYNGEPIGVSADSAFGMINRRYELHQKNGSFLPAQ